MTKKDEKIYQFKITLKSSKPPIWRRIQVPENYSFWELHVALQDAMGWEDYHLHQFDMTDPKNGFEVNIGNPDDLEYGRNIINEQKVKISKYFSSLNKKAFYEYDFGDGWEHTILLEKIIPQEAKVKYPRCIAGKRKCPPEDCGGLWGYEELLEIISDPKHPEYKERIEWLGNKFDPDDFNPEDIVFSGRKNRLY
ncbi:MAG TPA: plasmid pRiA4b ORF-3 family protein [Candidatus Megaira endosymbiont of Nemacystus decipiens]|nr:plasmid pRiA4b ORF-3 family protein [Candidatus Megaera endosymbiont of Nemacystus decipiens]